MNILEEGDEYYWEWLYKSFFGSLILSIGIILMAAIFGLNAVSSFSAVFMVSLSVIAITAGVFLLGDAIKSKVFYEIYLKKVNKRNELINEYKKQKSKNGSVHEDEVVNEYLETEER